MLSRCNIVAVYGIDLTRTRYPVKYRQTSAHVYIRVYIIDSQFGMTENGAVKLSRVRRDFPIISL